MYKNRYSLLVLLFIIFFVSCTKVSPPDYKGYLSGHKWYYSTIYGGPPTIVMTHCDSTVWYTFKTDGTGHVGNDDSSCNSTIYNIDFTYTVNSDIRLVTLTGIEGPGTAQEWYIDSLSNSIFRYTYNLSLGGGNEFNKHGVLLPR